MSMWLAAEIEAVSTIRPSTDCHSSEVSRNGASTLTAQVFSKPSADSLQRQQQQQQRQQQQ
jgi:hypothetical protein